jgi:hypothetical protein
MEKSALQEMLEGLQKLYSFKIRNYTGRGTYGRKCLSIAMDHHSVHSFELAFHLGRAAQDSGRFQDVEDMICETREDSMGFCSVIYWPHVEYVAPEAVIDEGDGDLND